MNWPRFLIAVAIAGALASMTDWYFFGVLFHSKYQAYPEVWRASQRGNRAAWITLGFFTCAVFTYACARLNLFGYAAPLKLALWMWRAVALPIVGTDALFMKLDALVVVAHALGWLVRLCVAGACVGLILTKG